MARIQVADIEKFDLEGLAAHIFTEEYKASAQMGSSFLDTDVDPRLTAIGNRVSALSKHFNEKLANVQSGQEILEIETEINKAHKVFKKFKDDSISDKLDSNQAKIEDMFKNLTLVIKGARQRVVSTLPNEFYKKLANVHSDSELFEIETEIEHARVAFKDFKSDTLDANQIFNDLVLAVEDARSYLPVRIERLGSIWNLEELLFKDPYTEHFDSIFKIAVTPNKEYKPGQAQGGKNLFELRKLYQNELKGLEAQSKELVQKFIVQEKGKISDYLARTKSAPNAQDLVGLERIALSAEANIEKVKNAIKDTKLEKQGLDLSVQPEYLQLKITKHKQAEELKKLAEDMQKEAEANLKKAEEMQKKAEEERKQAEEKKKEQEKVMRHQETEPILALVNGMIQQSALEFSSDTKQHKEAVTLTLEMIPLCNNYNKGDINKKTFAAGAVSVVKKALSSPLIENPAMAVFFKKLGVLIWLFLTRATEEQKNTRMTLFHADNSTQTLKIVKKLEACLDKLNKLQPEVTPEDTKPAAGGSQPS